MSEGKWISKSEGIKNIVEIIALLIAGVWAIFTFIIKDSPVLHQAIKGETQLHTYSLNEKNVNIEVSTTFTNLGQDIVNIDSARIEYWLLPFDSIIAKPFFSPGDYISQNNSTHSEIFYSLSGPYSSDQEFSQSFNFFIEKDSSKSIIAQVCFFLSRRNFFSRKKEISDVSYYDYNFHCVPDK